MPGLIAKVIIQVGCLSDEEIVAATKMVSEAGAEYVKTATGTGPAGRPNFHDARLMLDTLAELKSATQLKVSGVIEPRTINAYAFIRMGAALIGTRSAAQIVEALPEIQKWLYPN
jgi:deoxyribose-phosphate aldolase